MDEAGTGSRERIVAAALALFCGRGYAGVGTQEICAAAGVLKGTLYHFFPTKADVAIAAIEEYGRAGREKYARIAAGRGTPAGKLARLFADARAAADAARQAGGAVTGCLHGNLAMELSATEPRVRDVLERVADEWVAAITPMTGDVAAARAVLAYLHGAVLLAKTANDPRLITTLGRRAVGLLATN